MDDGGRVAVTLTDVAVGLAVGAVEVAERVVGAVTSMTIPTQ